MDFTERLEQYTEMINYNSKHISPKNQQILNKIFKELICSLGKPLNEFIDVLLENLLYPGTMNSNGFSQRLQCLGNSRILEIIYLRNKLFQLMGSVTDVHMEDYIEENIKILLKIHSLLIHILQKLTDQLEFEDFQFFYKEIVVNSINDFEKNFQSFKLLNNILQCLFHNVERSGFSDTKIFTVNDDLLSDIKIFTQCNTIWYQELILNSKALKEYLQVTNEATDIMVLIDELKFEKFLVKRKLKLNISNRRVF